MDGVEDAIAICGYEWELGTLVALGSTLVAVVAFGLALLQYRSTKAWDRKRYVAAECERLFNDPVCRAAFLMLDYTRRRICLYPDHPDYDKRFVLIDKGMVAKALIPHDFEGRPRMRALDAAIRDAFDQFFGRLELMYQFHKAGLIEIADLANPLGYLSDLIGGRKHMNPKVRRNLRVYLRSYDFDGVIALFTALGSPVRASDEELRRLKKLCEEGFWDSWPPPREEKSELHDVREHASAEGSGGQPRAAQSLS